MRPGAMPCQTLRRVVPGLAKKEAVARAVGWLKQGAFGPSGKRE